ncbi:hypothetical protein E2C01_045168 [Portunus trituberculatus]|uniref:Uncharacterized protein n=1 Tax=Portunus trituberculatus TaxID=210409 RepID=A0A5B7G4B2_PORTR|nr:hypothetical protein [Portunus trituberculatus]
MAIKTVVRHSYRCGLTGGAAASGCWKGETFGSNSCECNAQPFGMCRTNENRMCESSSLSKANTYKQDGRNGTSDENGSLNLDWSHQSSPAARHQAAAVCVSSAIVTPLQTTSTVTHAAPTEDIVYFGDSFCNIHTLVSRSTKVLQSAVPPLPPDKGQCPQFNPQLLLDFLMRLPCSNNLQL